MQDMNQTDTMGDMDGETYSMNTSQQGMYDGWPADRQASYDNWDMQTQEYYWTLTPEQTRAWWVLNNDQRSRIIAMTPEQRTATWQSISAQMNNSASTATGSNTQGMANSSASTTGMANSSTTGSMSSRSTTGMANSSTTGSMSGNTPGSATTGSMASTTGATASGNMGNMRFVRSEVVQATPGDQGPPTGDLPVCENNAQDNCINAWEAGRRGAGVTRPLENFPADRMADD